MASWQEHGRGRGADGAGQGARRAHGGGPAKPHRRHALPRQGTDCIGLCGRDSGLPRGADARRRAGAALAPHLAARCQPGRQHLHHRARPHHRCAALRGGRFRARVGRGRHAGAAVVRDRYQAHAGRELSGQRAAERPACQRCLGVSPCRAHSLGWQWLPHGHLRPRRHVGGDGRQQPAVW